MSLFFLVTLSVIEVLMLSVCRKVTTRCSFVTSILSVTLLVSEVLKFFAFCKVTILFSFVMSQFFKDIF